jgi:hypothetical protein
MWYMVKWAGGYAPLDGHFISGAFDMVVHERLITIMGRVGSKLAVKLDTELH